MAKKKQVLSKNRSSSKASVSVADKAEKAAPVTTARSKQSDKVAKPVKAAARSRAAASGESKVATSKVSTKKKAAAKKKPIAKVAAKKKVASKAVKSKTQSVAKTKAKVAAKSRGNTSAASKKKAIAKSTERSRVAKPKAELAPVDELVAEPVNTELAVDEHPVQDTALAGQPDQEGAAVELDSGVSEEKPTSQTEAATEKKDVVGVEIENTDDTFFVLLDGPSEPVAAVCASTDLSDEDDDSFLIMFDNDEGEEQEVVVDITDAGQCSITLPNDIRLQKLDSLKDSLLGTMEVKSVTVDTACVKRMDSASFQLLWSYSSSLKDMNIPLEIVGASEEFTNSSKLLGLSL